jgi:DNA-binding CsgD family transcriptional regulator
MNRVEDGMSTARALWTTTDRVSKHLEHVYRKLGVTSRTRRSPRCGGLAT